jgi:formylglycine-generating enzyme required for sulfatase activity/tRNA A-37 threonylcarbamoyl transferase component Bud32
MVLAVGTRIRDYEILSLIGEGGMGEVYLARDSVLGRMVALKRIKESETRDASFSQRFLNEARIQAKLNDTNIVSLYTCFEENGIYYIAMEYAPGTTLDELIKRTGPIPEQRAMRIFRQVAAALDHAHEHGIVHRDVKPSNIIVDVEHGDKVKVSDFGIARLMLDGHITRTGTQLGSPYYMSPEQVLAEKDVDHRSDIFSAGIVLYEMLSGKLPYQLDTDSLYKIHDQILRAPLPDPRHSYEFISDQIITLLNWLTRKDRNERPATLKQALAGLGTFPGHNHSPGTQPMREPQPKPRIVNPPKQTNTYTPQSLQTPDQDERPVKSGSGTRWMVIAGLVLVAALVGFLLLRGKTSKNDPDSIGGDLANMIRIEGGRFMMGSNYGDADERPIREVTVSTFYLSPYELTQAEWSQYMPVNPSSFVGSDRPVEGISWFDAIEYCNRRSQAENLTPCYSGTGDAVTFDQTANGYRLPTEEEWEYAAKGGLNQASYIYSGSAVLPNVAWYDENSGRTTHPVGSKLPNGLGLYDMSGNVYEWCWDRYFRTAKSQAAHPGTERVLRGGSWYQNSKSCRVSFRSNHKPGDTRPDWGLRLARGVTE